MALLFSPLVILKYFGIEHFEVFAGLSFTCFRSWEAYNNNTNREHPSFINYLVYLVFFPTLIAGPLTHFKEFNSNLDTKDENIPYHDLWILFLLGVLQKFVVAEGINQFWMVNLDYKSKLFSDILSNMYCYSTYLYFDFAGYSNMAIGLAGFFGITIPKNFDHPYLSLNPRDFWKRWHITLSKWLMDHLFIPLYKYSLGLPFFRNHPLLSQNLALSLTFVLVSIWAGFKPLYLICGIIIGVINSSHNIYVNLRGKNRFKVVDSIPLKVRKFSSWFLTIHSFLFAFYIFSGRFPYLLEYNKEKLPPIINSHNMTYQDDRTPLNRSYFHKTSISLKMRSIDSFFYLLDDIDAVGTISSQRTSPDTWVIKNRIFDKKLVLRLNYDYFIKFKDRYYGKKSEVAKKKIVELGKVHLPLEGIAIDDIIVLHKSNSTWKLIKYNSIDDTIKSEVLKIPHVRGTIRVLILSREFLPIESNFRGTFKEVRLHD